MADIHIRTEDALVEEGDSYNDGNKAPRLNLNYAGSNGLEFALSALANNTPYTQQQSIVLLTRAPSAWDKHRDGDKLIQTLKALIEKWPQNWDGFVTTLQIENNDTAAGWDRQTISSNSSVTRAPMEFTANGVELYNKSVSEFWKYFVKTLYKDPSTQRPNLAELTEVPDDWLIDKDTFDILVIEPDPTGKKVVYAIAVAGIRITTLPEDNLKRNTQEGTLTKEIAIGMKGIYSDSLGVKQVAQDYLDKLAVYSINPNLQPSFFEEVDADVEAADTGILDQAEEMKRTYKE